MSAPSSIAPSAPDLFAAAPGTLGAAPSVEPAARWGRWVCAVLGAYSAAVGLTSFLGWVLNIPRLTAWDPSNFSMQPNAALCALLSGAGVVLLALQRRMAARWLGLAGGLIAWATAFEWVSGVSLGIDQWFMFGREWGGVGVAYPGRMGPPGTASWSLIGLALLLAGTPGRARRLVPTLGLGVALISTISMLGYLLGATSLHTIPRLTVIAVQTATCIFAVGLGLIVSEPGRQPMALLISNTTAGMLSRRVFPLTVLLPVVLGWLVLSGVRADFYDKEFGSAMKAGINALLFTGLAWWMLRMVGARERALGQSRDDLAAALNRVEDERERYAVTLGSIGDGVIATDATARITFMNPIAQRLTGWEMAQARGRPLAEVFRIVNESTRQEVESAVAKAVRDGAVVGPANHTVLIARDGTEWPIDNSGAPIRAAKQGGGGEIVGAVIVFHEISERRATENRINASEVRYRRLFEAAHDGIIILDPTTRRITEINPYMLWLLKASRQEILGKRLFEIGPFADEAACEAAMGMVATSSSMRFDAVSVRDREGRAHPVEIVANLYQEGDGTVIQCNIRDASERVAFERERAARMAIEQSLRVEAERANRAKDLFLATLSHEIRTPLNAIVGWMSLLRRPGRTEADLREGLDVIERNAKAQTQLIADMMDVSRIVAGKLRLEVQPCDLSAVVRAGVDSVRTTAQARGIVLEVDLDAAGADAPASVVCDPARVQQIVWNLVANAVKFTPQGGMVRVTLAYEGPVAKIIVRDTGQGITPDLLPLVFDRFRQADSSTRRAFGGLGLGLSIAKHLAEMHGGSVHAHSEGEGKGSTFTVTLSVWPAPVDAGVPGALGALKDLGAAAGESAGEPPVRLDGLRVLVVDDEPDARRALARVLQEAGAIVAEAGSVAEAKKLLEEATPGVLVSDVAMPDEDGYDLIREVRAKGHTAASLPAVALTAFAGPGYARSALAAGFQVHVPKPVDPHDLILVVASLAGRTGKF